MREEKLGGNRERVERSHAMVQALIGTKHGEFELVRYLGRPNAHHLILARCSCGEERKLRLQEIREGQRLSCGHTHPWRNEPAVLNKKTKAMWKATGGQIRGGPDGRA